LRDKRHSHPGLIIGVLAAGGLLCGSALLVIMGSAERELPYVMIANLAALILAAVMVGTSLIDERRSLFWLGSLYVVLLILTRFLEYETSLLVKSAAFLACGVAVIFAGMKYEQYIRRKSTVMEPGGGREVVGE
jgi:general stress protein CsbA